MAEETIDSVRYNALGWHDSIPVITERALLHGNNTSYILCPCCEAFDKVKSPHTSLLIKARPEDGLIIGACSTPDCLLWSAEVTIDGEVEDASALQPI